MFAQTTITLAQARQVSAQQQQMRHAQRAARLAAFQEFKTSYCNLFDEADWQHYATATGLQLMTLFRFAQYSPAPIDTPARLFVRAPGKPVYEPYHLSDGYVSVDCLATRATPGLVAYLQRQNPEHSILMAADWFVANAG